MSKRIFNSFILLGLFIVSSCATIVGDKTQLIGVASSPDEAAIRITDEKGETVFKGETPAQVTLKKSDGSYFGGKSYVVTISKEHYRPVDVKIESGVNGWYVAGNIVFGGIIGWLIVDPFNGAMYNLSPEHISETLSEESEESSGEPASKILENRGSISIVLIQNVPTHLRSKMKRIHGPYDS